jgi:hypothetical protein
MRLERGPGSSLDGDLLAACLKALTADQFSAELATPPASCRAICMDQAARTVLLAAMPTLDDIDIAVVQRGDLLRGVTIPGVTVTGGRGGTTGGGRGGRGPGGSGCPSSTPAPARAREYPRGSFTTTMRYRPTRTNPYRCGYGRGSRLAGPAVLAPLRLSRQQPGPRARRARRTGGRQQWPWL